MTLTINNNSINFTLENIKVDGSQVVEGIKWLSKQIGFNTDVNISRDFNEINEIINYYKKEKCLINSHLIHQWNYNKNGSLTPEKVTNNSGKKVWWICDKGHEWQAVISSRNNNSNCPICGNKKLLKGYNDVATTNHQILLDWDYIKNDEIDPANCLATDKTMCWWKCHLCGFEYKKSIYNKVRSPRCPNCKSEK